MRIEPSSKTNETSRVSRDETSYNFVIQKVEIVFRLPMRYQLSQVIFGGITRCVRK